MSLLGDVIVMLVNGLQQGAIYVLLAIGLSIILGSLKFVNFAHGALYVIGAYVGLLITQEISISNGPLAQWGFPTHFQLKSTAVHSQCLRQHARD